MTGFELLYLCFGSFMSAAGFVMVVVYTASYPWWREHLGRMMVTYAMAEVAMSVILLVTVVGHVSPAWFRTVWFGLQTVIGCTFCYQTAVIVKYRRQRERTDG